MENFPNTSVDSHNILYFDSTISYDERYAPGTYESITKPTSLTSKFALYPWVKKSKKGSSPVGRICGNCSAIEGLPTGSLEGQPQTTLCREG
jgi:hypothetical protein